MRINIFPSTASSAACGLLLGLALVQPFAAQAANAGAEMKAKFQDLTAQLAQNQFGQPLYLESNESPSGSAGDIWAQIDHPFSAVESTFGAAVNWCDVLILHLNTKYCRPSGGQAGTTLAVSIGSKSPEPLDRASMMQFNFNIVSSTPEYYEAQLAADTGPFGTSNYHIQLQAIPAGKGRTFLHLTYSYDYGVAGRLAMRGYMATTGRNKVGFTIVGKLDDGSPKYIGGVRGVVERNTMRYFLAIDSYLDALSLPREQQLEKRLQTWFNASERYARQLHEVDRVAYLDMKREEYRRQHADN